MARRTIGVVAVAVLLTAALAGCAAEQRTTTGVDNLLSQMQKRFADGRLRSASVTGSTLTVKVSDPTQPSAVSAAFEAQMLAAAVRDSMSTGGQTPITSVQISGSNRDPFGSPGGTPGFGVSTLERGADIFPLAKGACESVAKSVQTSSLTIQSVLTFPSAGACAFRFQTSVPPTYATTGPLRNELVNGMGAWGKRPFLVEVDNKRGVPLLVESNGAYYTEPGTHIYPAHYSVRDVKRAFAAQGIELREATQPGLPRFVALLDGRPGHPVSVYVSRGLFIFGTEGHHVRLRSLSNGVEHPGGCRCIFKPPIPRTRLLSWGNVAVARRLSPAEESAVTAALEGLR